MARRARPGLRFVPTIAEIHDLEALTRLAPAWDELADAVDAPLFSRPFYCIPWARHMTSGRPAVVARFEGGELAGVTPTSRRSVAGLELIRFLGHGLGTVTAFVTAADDDPGREELWAALLGGRRQFAQLLELRPPEGVDCRPKGFPSRAQPRDVCLTIDCAPGLDAYMATRSKKLRENLRRAERSLAAGGRRHEVELVTTADRWRAVRAEVDHVFTLAETANPRQHLLAGPLAAFTDDFLTGSADAGRLRLFIGRVDADPVSIGIAFRCGSTLSYWITRFDPDFAAHSAGILLLRSIVEHGFASECSQIDLLLGDQAHKGRWSTDAYPTLTVEAGANQAVLQAGTTTLGAATLARRLRPPQSMRVPARGSDTSGAAP